MIPFLRVLVEILEVSQLVINSGSEGGLTLQSVYDLYLSLYTQVTAQAVKIKYLKAQVKKLKKQAKPFILHHKAWLRAGGKLSNLPNTEWDNFNMDNDDTIDYTLAQDKGKTDKVDEPRESTTQQQSTDRQAKAVSKEKEKGVEIRNAENAERPRTTLTRSVITLKPLPKIDPNDKGKKRIEEDEESGTESKEITEAKKKFDQIAHDEEVARKIQEEWEAEEERKRLTEEEATKTALSNEYDFIQARIEADRLLAERVQEAEREQFIVEERTKFLHDTIGTQRRILAQQRSEAIRNKPPTKNQFRNQMMTYLKHVGNKKHADLKTKSFDEIKALYEKVKRFDDSFITIGSTEDERKIKEMNEGASDPDKKKKILMEDVSAKVPAKQDVAEQGTNKRKGGHIKMIARKRKRPQPNVDSDDEHRKCLKIVTFEGTIDSEIMETKSFISKLDKVSSPEGDYLVVYKVNGNFRAFNYQMEALHIFDRQDLFHLYDLIMMDSSIEVIDQGNFWNDQQDWEIVTWRLYEACGVFILKFKDGIVIHMLVERKYPLSKELLQRMLDFGLEVKVESTAALDLIRYKNWLVHKQMAYVCVNLFILAPTLNQVVRSIFKGIYTYAIRNTKLLYGIEDSHHGPSDAMRNPTQPLKKESILQAGNLVKEILLKLSLPDHRLILTDLKIHIKMDMEYQKEVNEIHAEKIAKNANLLALVAAAQQYLDTYYQAPKPHRSYAPSTKTSPSTRSHATTRHKGKKIAKPITPPSESASEEDSDPKQAQRDTDIQKNLTLIAKYFKKIYKPTKNNLRTSSNTKNKNVDTTQRYVNENQTKKFGYQRTVTIVGPRETVGSQDTNEEIDKQELEAHYNFMAKIQEADQNTKECDDERTMLTNLIQNLKLDTDENKKIQKQLKKANTSLSHELQECKSALEECKSSLEKSNRTRDRYLGALHDKEVELEKYKIFKDHTIKNDTLDYKLKETLGLLAQKEHDIQEGIPKEKNKVIKDLKLKEEKDLDKLIAIVKLILFIVDSGCTKHMTGNDLLTGNRRSDLYIISLQETSSPTPICFLEKASPTQAWLWHRRLSHLNFDTINLLSKKDIVNGLPKLKYVMDQLCSSCELGKAKRSTFKTKVVPSLTGRLNLLHMNLCGPIGTKFLNKTLHAYFKEEGIEHQTSTPRTPEQNSVVKRRNRTLVEAARTMLLTSKLPLFFWAELVPNVSPPTDTNTLSLQELEFLFSPLFEEYFTLGNQSVSKSSSLSDNSKQQDTQPTANIQPITKPINPTTNVNAEENNNDQAADAQIKENEIFNIFSTPIREEAELSTRNVDISNMHTFYQHHQSEHRWSKDHPLKQVRGNPSKPVQTRRQLATNPKMCMFALTVSTAEPKNIKEVMVDSTWIGAMQDELHQFV
ncbi:retrovirus-related pol polyprotein from transposon TNT 1-94 [Tanacetum coccineum]